MHELSLAQSLVETAQKIALENNAKKVTSLTVSIGAMSGVVSDAFEFCFPEATRNTMLADCKLSIEEVPLTVYCPKCQKNSHPEIFYIRCSHCQNSDVEIIDGKEFKFKTMEVE